MIIEEALQEIHNYPKPDSERYYNENGVPVPRVTHILSCMMHSDNLMYWANSLGFKRISYKQFMADASHTGTQAHNTIESFLSNKIEEWESDNIPFRAFLAWYHQIIDGGNSFIVIAMEQKLSCRWFGGTYDLLCKINGRIYLVDFKTSNHITEKYFMQLAAYMYMLAEKSIHVDGLIVLQLSKIDETFNEYMIDMAIPSHAAFMEQCTRSFLSLVYAYYQVEYTRDLYNKIF